MITTWHPTPNGLALHHGANPSGYVLRVLGDGLEILHRHVSHDHRMGIVRGPANVVTAFRLWHPTWDVPTPDAEAIRQCSSRPIADVLAEWAREDRRSTIIGTIAQLERELAAMDAHPTEQEQ